MYDKQRHKLVIPICQKRQFRIRKVLRHFYLRHLCRQFWDVGTYLLSNHNRIIIYERPVCTNSKSSVACPKFRWVRRWVGTAPTSWTGSNWTWGCPTYPGTTSNGASCSIACGRSPGPSTSPTGYRNHCCRSAWALLCSSDHRGRTTSRGSRRLKTKWDADLLCARREETSDFEECLQQRNPQIASEAYTKSITWKVDSRLGLLPFLVSWRW